MGERPRLVVAAHPRSGSGSLVEILECHPELALLDEPFKIEATFGNDETGRIGYLALP